MYIDICVYIHMHIHMYTSTYAHTYSYCYMHTHIPVHTHVHIHVQIHVHIHVHMSMYSCAYIYIYIYIYIYMHTHIGALSPILPKLSGARRLVPHEVAGLLDDSHHLGSHGSSIALGLQIGFRVQGCVWLFRNGEPFKREL